MANTITTDEVRLRIDELNKIIQKNKEVGQAVATGITAMNSGITSAMRYNVMDKTLVVLRGVTSLFESLQTGRNLLQQVVDAYESADASLKNGVQDWVGDTNVMVSNKTLYPNMGNYSMRQYDYKMMYQGYNAGCMATAYAIGQSIVTGKPQDPMHFWIGNQASCKEAKVTGEIAPDLNAIYESLSNGKPTLLHFKHTGTGGQHWIVISGVNNYMGENLNYSNFTAIDPADGITKNLQELLNSYKGSNVVGMKQFL